MVTMAMNIFMVDKDPVVAAQCLADKHVVKMILESAQLLSTAHRLLDGDDGNEYLYKATHQNHPSAKWVRESVSNYLWLFDHFDGLLHEYKYRYDKHHKTDSLFYYLKLAPINLKDVGMTPIPCAMPEEYIISPDPVVNYRNYYNIGKRHLHKWTNRDKPEWIV